MVSDASQVLSRERHPYAGQTAAFGTLHRKDTAVRPALKRCLDLAVTAPDGIDTDALGTFTGETPRVGTMLDAARAKARLAMAATGLKLGIGSEGSFGPHPILPFVATGFELLILVDAERGTELIVQRRTRTNFATLVATPTTDLTDFLARVGFPAHALIVRAEDGATGWPLEKGVQSQAALDAAIARLAAQSPTGTVRLETDMRAHLNPTRMGEIGRLARRLALKAARRCPSCDCPGFGVVDVERGLPCENCHLPTSRIRAEIHGCPRCDYRALRKVRSATMRADPIWCEACNP